MEFYRKMKNAYLR